MNNVMKAARKNFLKQSGTTHLSKLEFTRHMFEAVLDHQKEEMQTVVAGESNEYELADCSKYFQIPADIWFEWSPETRTNHIDQLQKLSIDNIFQHKEVLEPGVTVMMMTF